MRAAWVGIAVVMVSACGPSAAEVRRARFALYRGCSREEVLQVVQYVVDRRYGKSSINAEDVVGFYYYPSRDPYQATTLDDGPVYELAIRAFVSEEEPGTFAVGTEGWVRRIERGQRPRPVEPFPRWADNELDELHLVLHEHLLHCEAAR